MASTTKHRRRQLTFEQKEQFREQIRQDGSDEKLHRLLSDWNSRVQEHDCLVDFRCLKRMRAELPKSPESIWETIKPEVEAEIARTNAFKEYEPRTEGYDYDGMKTTPVDAAKVEWASRSQMDSIRFDFENPKFHKNDDDKRKESSKKAFKADFRKHFQSTGMVCGAFNSFISQEEHDRDLAPLGQDCCPSSCNGPWKTVARVIKEDKKFQNKCKSAGTTFANFGTQEDRINPNFDSLKARYIDGQEGKFTEGESTKRGDIREALLHVLLICESVFRSVASWLPTCARKDSHGKKYAIPLELTASNFSLLSCLTKKTKAQIEHMDDHAPGASALWGLVPNQYVIVWWHSYEMNRELDELSSEFYDFVKQQPRPREWTEAAFWNLVAGLCLKAKGFASWRKPTPVKIPLPVGELLLMDYMVLHAGMPFVEGQDSLRGHLYWAQVAGREGEYASESTCFPWATYHRLYPSWRILSQGRRVYQ